MRIKVPYPWRTLLESKFQQRKAGSKLRVALPKVQQFLKIQQSRQR